MSLPIFVEILTPDGDVKSRHSFHELPIRIGRAYDNDIILDDPHTAAHHAQIDNNQLDELIVSNLGSLSGIKLHNNREDFFVINGDDQYQLGRTLIRIRTQDYQVANELEDAINHDWEGWRPATTSMVLLIAIGLLSTWLSDIHESNFSKYLLELVSVVGFVIGWSGVWALFSKLFSGHARFGRHLWIASCGLVTIELWDLFSGMIAFAFNWKFISLYSNHPVYFIAATVLYFHIHATGNKHLYRLKVILAVLAVITSAVTMTKQYQASNHLASKLYLNELYPPVLRISANTSLSDFVMEINSLKSAVDDARKDDNKKADAKDSPNEEPIESDIPTITE